MTNKQRQILRVISFLLYAFAIVDFCLGNFFHIDITGVSWSSEVVSIIAIAISVYIHQTKMKEEIQSAAYVSRGTVSLNLHLDSNKRRTGELEYQIYLDDELIGGGNLKKGYDITIKTTRGTHCISTYAPYYFRSVDPYYFTVIAKHSYRINMDYKIHRFDKDQPIEVFVAGIEDITEETA